MNWDPKTGRRQRTLGTDETLSFRAVAFALDGKRLATASLHPLTMKDMVVPWDSATGKKLTAAEDGDGQVNAVAFTPDDKALASAGGSTVKLWEIRAGR